MKKQISAEIVADSINTKGDRITTMVLTHPRSILAEILTHRNFSRNSASSRAIPFKKMVEMVENDPFIPIKWQKSHKGMQSNQHFTNEEMIVCLKQYWLCARDEAIYKAINLDNVNVTKQITNRILEPFMWHTTLVTATEFENFVALRAHPDAEIHIAELAERMLEALNESTPKSLGYGDWHIPFGDKFDEDRLFDISDNQINQDFEQFGDQLKVKIATARCARISYSNFEGKDDYEADIKLHDMLMVSGHMSPMEHCAKVHPNTEWSGNFKGFLQYRKMIPNESQTDSRLIKKEYGENMDKS